MNNNQIIISQATAPASDEDSTMVILAVLGYAEQPYTGPEVTVLADTAWGGIRKVTVPAQEVEVSTIFDDEPVDYDRM